jgi:hypothetical protein
MGTDASSMKDNAMNSENHTTEEKNSFNHMNHSIEQNQMKIETEAMQDVKVEKKRLLSFIIIIIFTFVVLLIFFFVCFNLFIVCCYRHRRIKRPVSLISYLIK